MTRRRGWALPQVRRILCPTDLSPASRPALAAATRAAQAGEAELLVVHVVPPVTRIPEIYVASTATFATFQRSVRAPAQRQLDQLLARARAAGVPASGRLLQGVPHEQIIRTARAWRADVIIMGTHGWTGLPRAFLGSVAARVVALAPCPVLTVRAGRR